MFNTDKETRKKYRRWAFLPAMIIVVFLVQYIDGRVKTYQYNSLMRGVYAQELEPTDDETLIEDDGPFVGITSRGEVCMIGEDEEGLYVKAHNGDFWTVKRAEETSGLQRFFMWLFGIDQITDTSTIENICSQYIDRLDQKDKDIVSIVLPELLQ